MTKKEPKHIPYTGKVWEPPMAQTAVEQLVNYMIENFHLTDEALEKFEEAKQMEREQIIEAYIEGEQILSESDCKAQQYYTQTYTTGLQKKTN